jgi:hypothetical protein
MRIVSDWRPEIDHVDDPVAGDYWSYSTDAGQQDPSMP